jgi:hypothetical protein
LCAQYRGATTTVLEPTLVERLRSALERGALQASAAADPMSAVPAHAAG